MIAFGGIYPRPERSPLWDFLGIGIGIASMNEKKTQKGLLPFEQESLIEPGDLPPQFSAYNRGF